jgi:hypothetical protein
MPKIPEYKPPVIRDYDRSGNSYFGREPVGALGGRSYLGGEPVGVLGGRSYLGGEPVGALGGRSYLGGEPVGALGGRSYLGGNSYSGAFGGRSSIFEKSRIEQQRAIETQKRQSIELEITKDPVNALSLLSTSGLPSSSRDKLTSEAVDSLVNRVERLTSASSADDIKPLAKLDTVRTGLAEVRAATDYVNTAKLSLLKAKLEKEYGSLSRDCLRDGVNDAAKLASKGDWDGAAGKARSTLEHIEPGEGRQSLAAFIEVANRRTLVRDLVKRLEGSPQEIITALKELNSEQLPAPARAGVKDLRELLELKETLQKDWNAEPAEFETLTSRLEACRKASENEADYRQIVNQLAAKAFLSGHPEQANHLLALSKASLKDHPPTPREKKLLDALHRDLGEAVHGAGGSVEVWAVTTAAPVKPGKTTHPIRGPPAGVELLLPEADRAGYKLTVKENPRNDLPTPPELVAPVVTERTKQVRDQAKQFGEKVKLDELTVLRHSKDRSVPLPHYLNTDVAVKPSPRLTPGAGLDETVSDEQFILLVEAELGRKLTPSERSQVPELRKTLKTASAVARAIRLKSRMSRSPYSPSREFDSLKLDPLERP